MSTNYKKIHEMLTVYWSKVSKRNVEYSCLEVFFATAVLFQNLWVEWENNSWNIEELKLITLAIDCLDEDITPNNFIGKEADYILVLKTYYEKNKNS